MKKSNSLMRGFYAGLLAGIFGGTTFIITSIVGEIIRTGYITTVVQDFMKPDVLRDYSIYMVGYLAIFGSISGIYYTIFYNRIPGKGVKKGIVFGCMIGLLSNIWMAFRYYLIGLFTGIEAFSSIALLGGFQMWFVYGLVLEPIYKRLNL
jgi:hypothetical protein